MELKPGYKQTEVGVIPEDWMLQPLSYLTILMTNGFVGPVKSHYTKQDDGVLYIQGYNIEENSFNFNGIKYVTLEFHKKQSKSSLREGDLLTIQTGDVGLTSYVQSELAGSNCHALIITRFKRDKYIPKFFSYYLNSHKGRTRLKEIETGTTMKHINVGDMVQFLVPYPPTKTEQTAIANTLSDADALIQSLTRLIAKKRQIKQGAMQTLFKPFDEKGVVKEGWNEECIGDLCTVFTKQTGFDYSAYIKPALVKRYEKGVIPFIQNKDFNGIFFNFNTDYYIPFRVAKDFPRILLNEKCLLISISGSVGNVGLFTSQTPAFLGGAIAVAKFHDKSKLDWAMYYLLSESGQKQLLINVKAGSHQNLILDDIRKIAIYFPPQEERENIVRLCIDLDADIAALETKLAKYRQIKQGMMQNLLTGRIRLI